MKTLQWLIRREFWENKGGFFWAPVIAGAVFLVINVLGLIAAQAAAGRANVQVGLIKLDSLLKAAPPEAKSAMVAGIDATMLIVVGLLTFVTAIVVFFYSLGALYDDRRDRSVLFWKSLPLSDRDTVISKVISALLIAPGIGMLAGMATALGMLFIMAIALAFHGQNVFGLFFLESHPFKMLFLAALTLPISMLWALPTVGWLMLCSAWARSKPFLWAVAVPVGMGIMVSWFDLMKSIQMPDAWFWKHVVGRMLASVFPANWLGINLGEQLENANSPQEVSELFNISTVLNILSSAELWIGAAAGIAMLVLATRIRRNRDDS
ncbi:hypothetical protein [Pseudomarimonas arenosa]|uniref:ABC-2 type transport system permease protein n=1 Tax=Pseudomarimonas arenosa TaxID=2774145 RepID=A0AAW3ZIM7_9GAMM|nr:hypothetical protein [Pseudomarimonas arenosa]MBD8524542.1 hypothetical protein [Pseudomarimonas arenosa]